MQQTVTQPADPADEEMTRWRNGQKTRHQEYLAVEQPRAYALIPAADLPLLYLAARHGAYQAGEHAPKVIVEAHLRRLFDVMDTSQKAFVLNAMAAYQAHIDQWVAAGGMKGKGV